MLSIKQYGGTWIDWHVGEGKEKLKKEAEIPDQIDMIQVDGDELNHVLAMYWVNDPNNQHYSIPVPMDVKTDVTLIYGEGYKRLMSTKRVIRWYGDTARMIVGNL